MLFKQAWQKYRKLLLILLVIDLLFTYAVPFLATKQSGTSKASILFAYEGIGQGLDPLGNSFDINEIKSEAVVKEALKQAKLEKKYTVAEVRKQIMIQPVGGGNVLTQLQSIAERAGKTEPVKEESYHAEQFIIGIKDRGAPSCIESKKLLKALLKSYQAEQKKVYLRESSLLKNAMKEELAPLDYPEQAVYLKQEADAVMRSADRYGMFAKQFRSAKGSVAFADLSVRGKTLRDQEVSNLAAMIDYYMLTQNIQRRLPLEEIRLQRADLSFNEALAKEITVSTAVGTYENSSNYLFLTSQMDALNALSQENPFYAELTAELMERKSDTIEKRHIAEQAEQRIARLQAIPFTAEEYAAWQKKAEAEAERLAEEIESLKKQLNELAEENYEKNIAGKVAISKAHYEVNAWGNPVGNYLILFLMAILIKMVCVRVEKSAWLQQWQGWKNWQKRLGRILTRQEDEQRRKEATGEQEP